jgi:hypothetical protein
MKAPALWSLGFSRKSTIKLREPFVTAVTNL